MKILGLVVKFLKPIVLDSTYLCNYLGPFKLLVGHNKGVVSVRFGQNPPSGFREENVLVKTLMDGGRRTKTCHISTLFSGYLRRNREIISQS